MICSDGKTRLNLWVYSQNKKNKELMGLFESCNDGFRLVKQEEEKDVFGRYVYSYVFQDYFTKKQTPFIPAHYDKTKLKYYGPKKRKIELEAFDKEEYRPLAELISSEIVKWKQERESVTKQFKSNIFANQENFKIIIEKINTLITELENRKEELDTLHSLYAG